MKISINGKEHEYEGPTITHEQIVALAGQPVHASVVYSSKRNGDSHRSGTTYSGKSIAVDDGMRFTAVVTGNA